MYRAYNLRSDDAEGIAKAEAYIVTHHHRGVRQRPDSEVRRAMDSGLAIIIERKFDHEICGCSLIYHYHSNSTSPLYSEIGTMRVTENGFGFQRLLTSLHLLQLALEDFEHPDRTIFAVVDHESDSEHNMVHHCELADWTPSPDLMVLREIAGVPFNLNKRTISAKPDTLLKARRDLVEWHCDGNKFDTPKGQRYVELEMGWFSPTLLD